MLEAGTALLVGGRIAAAGGQEERLPEAAVIIGQMVELLGWTAIVAKGSPVPELAWLAAPIAVSFVVEEIHYEALHAKLLPLTAAALLLLRAAQAHRWSYTISSFAAGGSALVSFEKKTAVDRCEPRVSLTPLKSRPYLAIDAPERGAVMHLQELILADQWDEAVELAQCAELRNSSHRLQIERHARELFVHTQLENGAETVNPPPRLYDDPLQEDL